MLLCKKKVTNQNTSCSYDLVTDESYDIEE